MRLIDADRLMTVFKSNSGSVLEESLLGIVRCQPTAYDVKKVVSQLEEYIRESNNIDYNRAMVEAIETIKVGGK